MRKLVSIQKISAKYPIPNADRIELIKINDWCCIAKKDEFQIDDKCVYFEIDSFLPIEERYAFLETSRRIFLGIIGYRIKTMKMKGVVSQGLALPLHMFPELTGTEEDVTDILKIIKYDLAEVGTNKVGVKLKGSKNFPAFLRKTDQERIQNLPQYYEMYKDAEFEETMKLDGSSCTMYKITRELTLWHRVKMFFGFKVALTHFGVCSRNLEISRGQEFTRMFNNDGKESTYKTSDFWQVAEKYGVENLLPVGYAIQGELIGTKIQANHEKVTENEFYIFDVWDIQKQKYLLPDERHKFVQIVLADAVKHVPVVNKSVQVFQECENVEQLLKRVEGESMNKGTVSEGRVYKMCTNPDVTFKCINNQYLLKCED